MQDERLRLLALWHGLRRDVDLLLEPLLAHGPVAVARVTGHLAELDRAVGREQSAFTAFRAACRDPEQERRAEAAAPAGPEPVVIDLEPVPVGAPGALPDRDDLAAGRARAQVPAPSRSGELEQDATVLRLPERPSPVQQS